MAFAGEGNFLKKVFLPPHPYPSKTFKQKNIDKNKKMTRP